MQAEIITIGDEILIGQIVDTNSAWMAKELNKYGIGVSKITSISDEAEDIVRTIEAAMKRTPLVLMTGGLGPTNDDITKKTLSDYFGMKLVQDDALYQKIQDRLAKYGIPMNRFNREQALIPDGARIFPNNFGSAPCMWFEKENRVLISMPGVPFEMKGIMQNGLISAITEHFETPEIVHKTIMTDGIGESVLADMLSDWEENLPQQMKLAYLPSPGKVRLRLSITGEHKSTLEKIINKEVEKLKLILPDNIFAYDDIAIEQCIAELLLAKGKTLGTAESCTGGYIAHLITSQAGSSAYFKGSIVSYANEIKENVLGVNSKDLEELGAVSKEVVEQMAEGARRVLNTDYAVATSGIAGPDGGSEEKPVGTVWIALAGDFGVISEKLELYKVRERNIKVSAFRVLNLLRKELEK
ncbi:competence/damage-inducible protein A [Marinifilum caeruleilacunae]|uniref:CinA-like protein n=1 Tax=Marinifilum caeruleilacunae TaxID=2499076 RepID=A0ABX1X182_9BACT|nr:competence/damage-inducible protein A [Marinifilum caeruleilacunae]NOU61891.1 competence/damage-inducible protein A [Marinifilum caeruleilacunae]